MVFNCLRLADKRELRLIEALEFMCRFSLYHFINLDGRATTASISQYNVDLIPHRDCRFVYNGISMYNETSF